MLAKGLFYFLFLTLFFTASGISYAEETKNFDVTATVPPNQNQVHLDIIPLFSGDLVPQEAILEYKIEYGTTLSYSTNLTIETYWDDGKIENGQTIPESLLYVIGSATNGFNGSVPTVDLINKKITWQINSYPPNTSDKLVSFKLKTTSNYKGDQKMDLPVKARIIVASTPLPFKHANKTYKYKAPQLTPTPTPSVTLTPTPTPSLIRSTNIREVVSRQFKVSAETTSLTRVNLRYGPSPSNITQTVSSSSLGTSHLLTIGGLSPETRYYFRIIATTQSGRSSTSDIFSIITAKDSEPKAVEKNSVLVTSGNAILSEPSVQGEERKEIKILIPKESTFKFRFTLKDKTAAKKITIKVKNKNVLGIFSFGPENVSATSEVAEVIEVEPGVYEAVLATQPTEGEYELYAVIEDDQGNLVEEKIAEIKVLGKFMVLSNKKKPIEGARIYIEVYESKDRHFEKVIPGTLLSSNPVFTDTKGEADIVLPVGKYRALVTNFGYLDKTVEFGIGNSEKDGYPKVTLENSGFSVNRLLRYYYRSINDIFLLNTTTYVKSLTGSLRFFDLIASISIVSLVIISFYAFTKRVKIPILSILSYFFYLLHQLSGRKIGSKNYVSGKILDQGEKPISSAQVYIMGSDEGSILKVCRTDKNGVFYFRLNGDKYELFAMKSGFKPSRIVKYDPSKKQFLIELEQVDTGKAKVFYYLRELLEESIGLSFEFILIISVIFEVLLIETFGLLRTLPYLMLSVFNLSVWIMHLRHSHRKTI